MFLFSFCFLWGVSFVNTYEFFYLIYNNTLLHSTCTVALLKVGFQYIYIATGDLTNNVNSSFDKHYTISRKKLTWYHGEVIGQQFLLEKINEYWCRWSITLIWPIRPNSLGLATYLIQIAAPVNFLGISLFYAWSKMFVGWI